MAKPSKIESSETDHVTYWNGAKATNVYTKIDAIIDDYASISEGVDADTLEGSTKAEVQNHAPASHGNEAHSETYITIGDVPAGGSGADGKDGVGFVAGMLTLWDKSLGGVPEDFVEVSELAGTNFTVIKFVGGENLTNVTHSLVATLGATVTLTLLDYNGDPLLQPLLMTNGTFTPALAYPNDKPIFVYFAKSDASDVVYDIVAIDPETGITHIDISVTVPGESNITTIFILPKACNIKIEAV